MIDVAQELASSTSVMLPLLQRVCEGNSSAVIAIRALLGHLALVGPLLKMGVGEAFERAASSNDVTVVTTIFEAFSVIVEAVLAKMGTDYDKAAQLVPTSIVGKALGCLDQGALRHSAGVLLSTAIQVNTHVAAILGHQVVEALSMPLQV